MKKIFAFTTGLLLAALAHGANHLVTLVASSMDLLRAAGVENPQRLLGPLLSAALDNALRHGSSTLDISATRRGNLLQLVVIDNGEGVSPNNRTQIFDSFFTTRRDSGGTGMGLAIVRAMLDAHGGAIRLLESVQGTAFELTIPLADEPPG